MKHGTLFTLEFEVNPNAAEWDYPVWVQLLGNQSANLVNIDSENVAATFSGGAVRVSTTAESELSIERIIETATGCEAILNNPKEGVAIYFATYGASGNMMEVSNQPVTASDRYIFSPKTNGFKRITVFVLDMDFSPCCTSETVVLP